MTTDPHTAVDRIPLTRSVHYVARGLPEVPNQYGPGVLAPSEITLTYRAAPDSQLGRVHAYVTGRIWVDGKELPLLPGGLYGQHYLDGLDNWPAWLAEEARLHDPEPAASAGLGVSATPSHTDQDAVLLSEAERLMLRHALDLADANVSARPDEYTAADEAALAALRRLADEAQQQEPESGCAHCGGDHSWDDCQAYTAVVADEPRSEPPVHGESVAHLASLHDDEQEQSETETLRTPAAGRAPTELRVRVLREILNRLDGSRSDGDSATQDVGASTVRAVLADILADMQPADEAAVEPFPIWTVWREDEPAHGHYATEDIAKRASIDCWEEQEPSCPDYSWRPDGGPGNWELLVGGERAEVYIRRHLVYGGLPQPPRAAVLREAAQHLYTALFPAVYDDMGQKAAEGVQRAVSELRRLADDEPATGAEHADTETVHACPPDGSVLTPCCGRTPFELPLGDRISSEAPTTCTGPTAGAGQDGAQQ